MTYAKQHQNGHEHRARECGHCRILCDLTERPVGVPVTQQQTAQRFALEQSLCLLFELRICRVGQ